MVEMKTWHCFILTLRPVSVRVEYWFPVLKMITGDSILLECAGRNIVYGVAILLR